MSNHGREVLYTSVALTGALLMTGCSGGSSSPEQSSETAATSASLAPNTEIVTGQVDGGPSGALRDAGMEIAWEISDVNASADDTEQAFADAAAIPNSLISGFTTDFVNWRLARNTRYTGQSLYTYSDDALKSSQESVANAEGIVDRIGNADVKALAEKALDYQEASAGVEAATRHPNETPEITALYLGSVEDQAILALARSAIGGNQADKKALAQQDTQTESAVETGYFAAYNALYDGSNSQAKAINDQIAQFNSGRAVTGD